MAGRTRGKPDDPLPPFTGFGAGAVAFFHDLDAHQTREWFEENRARYESEARRPMEQLVASLGFALAADEVPLIGDPRRALFRIHRDVRFARDKRPYKTNVSAVLTRDGDKRSQGLLYVDIGLAGCFAALGFYMPEPDQLAAIRQRILAMPSRWRAVEEALATAGLELGRDGAAARLPREIDPAKTAGLDDALRLKSFVVRRPIAEADLLEPALVDQLARFAKDGLPLLEFGWSALADRAPTRS